MHNWEHDPFSRGAYSYAVVGGDEMEMFAPVVERLAGT